MKLNLIGQTAVVNKNMGVMFYDNKTKRLTAKPYTNLNQVIAEITSVLNTNHIVYKDLQHDNYCYGYNNKDDTFVVYLSAGSNFSITSNQTGLLSTTSTIGATCHKTVSVICFCS